MGCCKRWVTSQEGWESLIFLHFTRATCGGESPAVWEKQAKCLCFDLKPFWSYHDKRWDEERLVMKGTEFGGGKCALPGIQRTREERPWSDECLSSLTISSFSVWLITFFHVFLFPLCLCFLLHFIFSSHSSHQPPSPPSSSNCWNTMNHWYSFFSHGCIFQLLGI